MLVVLVGTTVFGFWKGMAWQIASLSSLVASYLVALRFSVTLAPYFGVQAPLNWFAMLVLLRNEPGDLADVPRHRPGSIAAGWGFDRQIGGLFGRLRVLFCIGITFFAVTLSEAARETVLGSAAATTLPCCWTKPTP